VRATAAELRLPFLGEIPFVPKIQSETDVGRPPALRGDATLEEAKPYYDLAEATVRALESVGKVEVPTVRVED
jgi:ATP-binding protein involved in chromosome partitioning